MPVEIDLNDPDFQDSLFNLEKAELWALVKTLRKIAKLEWNDLYKDSGLKWEAIDSRVGERLERLYSIRITQKFRAVVQRRGEIMMFLELHPDHDSAY
jgi:hypothetical protein